MTNYINPIRLISNSFTDIINDLNTDPRTADAPYLFKAIFAGVFALLTLRTNVLGNQVLLSTAEDRTIAEDILAWQDYRMQGKAPSSVDIDIAIDPSATASGPYTIPAVDLVVVRPASGTDPDLRFEARAPLTFPIFTSTTIFTAYQQTTKPQVQIGVSETGNLLTYDFPDKDVIPETCTLTIGGDTYYPARVFFSKTYDSFVEATETDPVFLLKCDSDGNCSAILGFIDEVDGVQYGKLPAAGLSIYADYAVGGGTIGNVDADTVTEYAGSDVNVLTVNNPQEGENGTDAETLANAKRVAPLRARTHEMFWDSASGEAIAMSVPGVLLANVVIDGLMQATASIMPVGGGIPAPALLTSVETQLLAASYFEQVTLTVQSVSYLYIAIQATAVMLPGTVVTFATAQRNCAVGIALRSHPTGRSIFEYYLDNGMVDGLITLINTNLGTVTGFTYTLSGDGPQIKTFLDNLEYMDFGQTFGPEDIAEVGSFVRGVSYISTQNPASRVFPGTDEIINPASITVVQG